MNQLIARLPPDIVNDYILPFTYSPQPTELCQDICSYYQTMKNTRDMYSRAFPTLPSTPTGDTDIAWLSNDICRFLNNDLPTLYGYTQFHREVYQRMYRNRTKPLEAIPAYINFVDRYLFPSDIKIVIGLLQPNERLDLEKFLEK